MVRLLGFDIRIRPGFVVFLALVVGLYADAFGLWLAAALTVFTVVHELAHAVAARRFGAHARIDLELFAGTTSYTAPRPLRPGQQAVVAAAGPVVHLATATAVLLALGVDPTDPRSIGSSPAIAAIWWAGLAIGAFNLIPVFPLDGGQLLRSGLAAVIGGRADRVVLVWSLGVTGAVLAWLVVDPTRRWYSIFAAFLLLAQWQRHVAMRGPSDRRDAVGPPSPFAANDRIDPTATISPTAPGRGPAAGPRPPRA